jgi:hypothetical protein
MESKHADSHAPAVAAGGAQNFIKRELDGATFLTLEHIAHMALIVLVPLLVLMGLSSAFSMWTGAGGVAESILGSAITGGAGIKAFEASMGLGVVAALLVLVPALVILDRRTRAEWRKRPGYTGRLAYKAPLYSALGVLGAIMVAAKIQMVYVIVASLAFLGVPNAPIGSMYLTIFVPALVVLFVAFGTFWYLFKLAKGKDNGRMFSMGLAALGGVLVVALFVTGIIVLHGNGNVFTVPSARPAPTNPYDSQYYPDILNQYQ